MTKLAVDLSDQHGHWGSHRKFPVGDWKYCVDNDETRMGYWDWVAAQVELTK